MTYHSGLTNGRSNPMLTTTGHRTRQLSPPPGSFPVDPPITRTHLSPPQSHLTPIDTALYCTKVLHCDHLCFVRFLLAQIPISWDNPFPPNKHGGAIISETITLHSWEVHVSVGYDCVNRKTMIY